MNFESNSGSSAIQPEERALRIQLFVYAIYKFWVSTLELQKAEKKRECIVMDTAVWEVVFKKKVFFEKENAKVVIIMKTRTTAAATKAAAIAATILFLVGNRVRVGALASLFTFARHYLKISESV